MYGSDMRINGMEPQLGKECYIAPTAVLVGNVLIGDQSSVWFNAVVRGDVTPIVIGKQSNLQDGVVVHGTYQKADVRIGDRVTVGHGVILHGCRIEDSCLIGMGSILMDLSHIGHHCLVGAGSLVTEGSVFEPGTLIMGRPAKAVRKLRQDEIDKLERSADNYLFYINSWYQGEG